MTTPSASSDHVTPGSSPTLPAEVLSAAPDARVGKFVRTARLGAGGMGEVWKAWDAALKRWVALKFLKGSDDAEIARFTREAQVAGSLAHPNIAAIYEVGGDEARRWIAMQYIDGQTLRSWEGPPREAGRLARDAARAVAYAHDRGIVHRDLKPENVMLTADGHLYVMDFGLARHVEAGEGVSISGSIVGTPAYMPPEQARGDRVDARADVWSLGATLYALLVKRPPFRGATVLDTMARVQNEEPRPPRAIDPTVPRELNTVVMKCLEKDPARRYPSAAALADDLDRWLAGDAILAHPPSLLYRWGKRVSKRKALLAMAAAGLAGVLGVVAVLWPMLARTRRALELWGEIAGLASEAEVNARLGQQDRAIERLDEGIRRCRAHLQRGESAHAWYFLGRLLRQRNDRGGAIEAFDRALRLDPGLGEARVERGVLLVDRFESLRRRRSLEREAVAETLKRQPDLAELARRIEEDLAAPVGRSSYFREVDSRYGAALHRFVQGDDRAEEAFRNVLKEDPAHTGAICHLALAALIRGDFDGTISLAGQALKVHQGYATAYLVRAHAVLRLAERRSESGEGADLWVLGLADINRAIELGDDDPDTYYLRGNAHIGRGDADGAIADFERVLRDAPEIDEAVAALGTCRSMRADRLAADGRLDEALAESDRALADADRAVRMRPDQASYRAGRGGVRHERAVALRRGGRSTEADAELRRALEDYDEAIRREASMRRAHYHRAGVREALGQWAEAIADYTREIETEPKFAIALIARGEARLEIARTLAAPEASAQRDAAISDFSAAIEVNPRLAAAWLGRGHAKRAQSRAAESLDDFVKASELDPADPAAWVGRAGAHYERREFGRVEEDARRAIELDPNRAMGHFYLAVVRHQQDRDAEAIEGYSRAIELDRTLRDAWGSRGVLRAHADPPAAIADLSEAIRLGLRNAEAYFWRAIARAKTRDVRGAEDDLNEAIILDPAHALAYLNRGLIRERAGDGLSGAGKAELARGAWTAALADLERALELRVTEIPPDQLRARIEALREKLK